MIEVKHFTDDDLRVKHNVEVLGHKADEVDTVQLEQDEAIAAIYEEFIGLLFNEEGEPVEMVDRETVVQTCKDLIDKAVARKVNTAVKKAVDDFKETLKAEILEEISVGVTITDDGQVIVDGEETAEGGSEEPQEGESVEDEETVDSTEETSEEAAEPSQDDE